MSTPFQNRLVGTVIVAAAAVIFLPDFLDGKKQAYQAEFENIPKTPNISAPPPEKKFPVEKIAKIPTKQIDNEQALSDVFEKQKYNQVIENNTTKVKVNALTKENDFSANKAVTELNKKDVSVAETLNKTIQGKQWVIQLGSFRHEKNVQVLVNKLKENGFSVFTKPIKTKNGSLTKVFVGPSLVKSTIEKKLPKLKELTKVDGKVSRY